MLSTYIYIDVDFFENFNACAEMFMLNSISIVYSERMV